MIRLVVSDLKMHQEGQLRAAPRLVKAAHEFEAQMMKELLAPLHAESGLGGDEESGSSGALGDFASEALGQALSRQGGFGLADKLIVQLSGTGKGVQGTRVTENVNGNTEMRIGQ